MKNLKNKKNWKNVKNENPDFKMGPNTSVYQSCTAKLNGEMFVYGGDIYSGNNKQVTQKLINGTLQISYRRKDTFCDEYLICWHLKS